MIYENLTTAYKPDQDVIIAILDVDKYKDSAENGLYNHAAIV